MNTRHTPDRFAGRVVLVSGGASGIGAASARLFAHEGAAVAILDTDARAGEACATQIRDAGGAAAFHEVDVTEEGAVEKSVAETLNEFGRLDAAHLNAGIEYARTFAETPIEDWRHVIDVNLTGAAVVARAVIAPMSRQNSGAIVLTASTLALLGAAETSAYSAAKAGMLALVRVLAIELASAGIRVNAILPGAIDTPMLRREATLAPDPDLQARRFAAISPMDRLGRPEEIAAAALFLCSDAASFITGTSLAVDGGVSAVQSAGPALTYTE